MLTAPVATVTKAKVADLVRTAVAEERASTQAALEALAAIIGEETGKADESWPSRFARHEIVELRAELHELRGERSAGVIDLPDWRSHAAH